MNIIHIFVFAVLAAVAVLLARIAVRLWESRHNEERQLDASAHTVARLISRRLHLSRLLGSSLLTVFAAAVLAACSSSDDNIIGEQPMIPTAETYTMTVQATKDDYAATRGLALNDKTLSVKWNEGEEVEVMMADNAISGTYTSIGTLTAAASETGETTLTGTVSGLTEGKALRFFLRGHDMDYTGQKGVLLNSDDAVNSIEAKYDYAATEDVTAYTVSGTTVTVAGGITLTSQQAIVKFNLQDQSGNPINATSLTIKENTGANGHICLWRDANKISGNTLGRLTITPAAATSTVYAAIYDFHNATSATSSYTLESTDADGNTYAYTKEGILFASGQYYEVSVKMRPLVDLATINDDYTAADGTMLTGTLNADVKIVKIAVADGATVTLRNVTIESKDNGNDHYKWAGITCEGDATLVIEGSNTVQALHYFEPGIYVPEGKTLTIRGSGSLTAKCNQGYDKKGGILPSGAGIGGTVDDVNCGNIVIESGTIYCEGGYESAGIGSADQKTCGTITITGGTVTAKGGDLGAGIGSGYTTTCGSISITGGTVTATGGNFSAAIGSGKDSSCSDITIGGTANVTATKGENSPYTVGLGYNGTFGVKTCGTITIGGTVYYDGTDFQKDGDTYLSASPFTWPTP